MYRLKLPQPRIPHQDLSFAVEFKKQKLSMKQICKSPQQVFIKMTKQNPQNTRFHRPCIPLSPKQVVFTQKPFSTLNCAENNKLVSTQIQIQTDFSLQIKKVHFLEKTIQKKSFRRQCPIYKNASNILELSDSDDILGNTEIICNRINDIDIFSELSE
ncbi:hypothetical protein SS50377_28129 [Spironucleus salmonicida]|uniref:Uncharacterized protein n=1 Tax=Spironucleus salmonicida TaxID=348837 RepID=V6LEW8_9EUKA|nr:hypothetical protein SS50377_28129 [Spironucleus salmonicida]|eukprot:EST42813.1 Hypothetical protein SS50377_17582 [Spironucleus salmonicida]